MGWSMQLNLLPVLNGVSDCLSFDEKLDMSGLELITDEYPLKEPVRAFGEVISLSGMVGLNLKLDLNVEGIVYTKCARCNKELSAPIAVKSNYILITADEAEANEENEDVLILSGYKLLLDDLVSDSLIINMPMRYLCKDDCKGLCPVCGIDLNKEKCECLSKKIDPRLEKLKAFFEE
jgi:uncharacterized protein